MRFGLWSAFWACFATLTVAAGENDTHIDFVAAALEAACADVDLDSRPTLPDASLLNVEPVRMRGARVGVRFVFEREGGVQVRVDRLAPGGRLRRLNAELSEPSANGLLPTLFATASPSCRMLRIRRLRYEAGDAVHLDVLGPPDGRLLSSQALNPPVPALLDESIPADAVPVALVDSGVNYVLPDVNARLARDAQGRVLGYDFWDMDERPFDSHPSGSPFFPNRHGTQTASIIMAESPPAMIIPYRYPRADMSRMSALVRHAADRGVVVVNMSLGSRDASDWKAFAEAAREHPDMLFVVSAGNDGKNIDETPVYPAALPLDNLLTITSGLADGTLARGSSYGEKTVDLMVPGEGLLGHDFSGRSKLLSGASYAAARVSALAACLLAENPTWRAPRLKREIVALAEWPNASLRGQVAHGFVPSLLHERRGSCEAERTAVEPSSETIWTSALVYADGDVPSTATHALDLALVTAREGGWPLQRVLNATREAAEIFKQCGVLFRSVRLHSVHAPRRYLQIEELTASNFAAEVTPTRPSVFFVRDALPGLDFEAFAYGLSNSRHLPSLRFSAWLTRGLRDPGISLAHEIVHILINGGAHDPDPTNLMHAQTSGDNLSLREDQCERLLRVGTALGTLDTIE